MSYFCVKESEEVPRFIQLVLKHEQELEALKTEYEIKIVELTEHHVTTARNLQLRHSSEIEALKKQHSMSLKGKEDS
ncbi:uncharacterized protein LOC143255612 isoform X2 [Tachypleus tridentatus]|uniref:uncharacterized protein LOC143255612 isoform X2 n=1 Tax=Tachypleus tridentatus TaxID=6853 RepID=UPI003FD033AB